MSNPTMGKTKGPSRRPVAIKLIVVLVVAVALAELFEHTNPFPQALGIIELTIYASAGAVWIIWIGDYRRELRESRRSNTGGSRRNEP